MSSSGVVLQGRVGVWGAVVGGVVCAGLVAGGVSPSWATGESSGSATSPVVGAFGMGAAVQGTVDERSGSFSFEVPLGGVTLGWDSAGSGAGRFGFGPRWALAGIGFVDVEGGVRVVPSRGVQGVFEADDSVPSGLAGYVGDDVRFAQTPGVLPARADGLVGEREYAFVLRELGGLVSYFDAAGDPVAKLDAHGGRIDMTWEPGHRLTRVVTETGVVTSLDWSDPARVTVHTTAGTGQARLAGTVESDGGQVVAVVDATGGTTTVGYAPSGLVERVGAASGAVTNLTWQMLPDGTATVERVVVTDPVTGEQVTDRRWEAVAGLASGWPVVNGSAAQSVGASAAEFRTAVTDGVNRVVSVYDGAGLMTGRDTSVSSTSGERVLQQHSFTYPDRNDEAPGRADRPTGIELTFTNDAGATKTVSEGFVFDMYGRVTQRTAVDGTVKTTQYDPEIPGDPQIPGDPELPEHLRVPAGLPVLERVTAPDGSVTESRYELNEARTAVVVAETFTGETGGELVRTGRSEFTVESDGFVSAERVYPQGGEGTPMVSEHTKSIDLVGGTMTRTDTIAAGTELAAVTSTVTDLVHGQPLTATDVLGNTTTASYDEAGRPVEVTDPAGNVTRTEYRDRQHGGVNATITTGPDRVEVSEEQDVIGRPTRLLDNIADGVATAGYVRVAETREYLSPTTVRVTDPWGWQTTTEQDAFGRTTRATLSSGVSQVAEYDEVAGTQSAGTTTTGELADAELVMTQHVDLNGHVTGTSGVRADGLPIADTVAEFDGFGRQTRSSDGAADVRIEHDVHGNPVTTTIEPTSTAIGADAADAAGDPLVATRRFDERGASMEKTLSAAGESRTGGQWEYDLLGREQSVTDQAGGVTSYEYTPDGLIAEQTTSSGMVTTNTYDPSTRELTETVTTSPVGDPVRTGYEYDDATGRVLAVFDPADPEHTTIRYEYDAWGNVTELGYPDGKTIQHEYDAHGRKTHTTDAAGATTEFQHDASGLLTGAVQHDANGDPIASVSYTYDDYGRVTGIDRGNGVHTEVTFTSASEIASETTTGPDGLQSARVYSYDSTGNLTTRTDTVTDPTTHEQSTTATAYEYDLHHRLVASTIHDGDTTDGAVRSQTAYTLNVSGDVTREQVTTSPDTPDASVRTRDLEYSPTGQLTRIFTTHPDGITTQTQEYDTAGNLTLAEDGTRYAYNALNQPVQETTPTGATILTGYWATGDRATVTAGDEATGFYWNDGTLLNDTHAAAGTTQSASYLTGITRESRTLNSTAYAVHDRHGNTTELTDQSGTQTTRYTYSDYGTTMTHAVSEPSPDEASRYPFLYAGEYTNRTGSQHLAVRTYLADQFAFTSADTMPLQNRYGYANANPITYVDPSGHFAWTDVTASGLFVGAAMMLGAVTLVGGLAGMTAASSLIGFITANATSVAFGTVAVLAGVASSTIETLRFLDDYVTKFLDQDTNTRLFYAEYTLIGLGFVSSVVSAVTTPAMMAKWSKFVSSPTVKPGPASTKSHIPTEDEILTSAQDRAAQFLVSRNQAVKSVGSTVEYQKAKLLSAYNPSDIVTALEDAKQGLTKLQTAYFTARTGWTNGIPTHSQLNDFVLRNWSTADAIDTSIGIVKTGAQAKVNALETAWQEVVDAATLHRDALSFSV